MSGKIKHIAIITDDCHRLARFYQVAFGLSAELSEEGKHFRSAHRAVALTDGYVGLNFNFRNPGRPASLDHFGIEVEDVELVFARLREKYPSVEYIRRPGGRAFAGISAHDAAGNVFDLSNEQMENRASVYKESSNGSHPRSVHHLMLRAIDPAAIADFYRAVFEFEQLPSNDGCYHLSDGKVVLMIAPWKLSYYKGMGIEKPKLDHIGFTVESLDVVERDLATLAGSNSSARAIGQGVESEGRLRLLSSCKYGRRHLADPDGTLIDIGE
jgi:catechol 2,3-dioxygenase-like lactoylglutathione lyase family enzyme